MTANNVRSVNLGAIVLIFLIARRLFGVAAGIAAAASYELARQDHAGYVALADTAQMRMKEYVAMENIWPRLQAALALVNTETTSTQVA